MSNFDLVDDYLTNRLSGSERSAFEEGMNADPALKMEVERQNVIVEGIRKARANELKAMLNKVPVGGASIWGENAVLKIAATIGVAGLIGTAMYFYNTNSGTPMKTVPSAEIKTDSLIPKNDTPETPIENKEELVDKKPNNSTTQRAAKPKKAEATAPKIDVVDPSKEMLNEDADSEQTLVTNNLGISMATIQVERDSQNKTFNFHYQFSNKKLFLFGPFDEALYEILEIHGDNHALFLYFKDSFYLLNEANTEITELTPIRDRPLVQKLKEFRSRK
jgi:hypothetical protein